MSRSGQTWTYHETESLLETRVARTMEEETVLAHSQRISSNSQYRLDKNPETFQRKRGK